MSVPASRPVHPCVTTLTKQGSRGVEFSTWAYVTHCRGNDNNNEDDNSDNLPNLITASGSSLHVYTPLPENGGKLRLDASFPNIAGTVVFLATLPSKNPAHEPDALLLGFGMPPRLVVVTLQPEENYGDAGAAATAEALQETKTTCPAPHLLRAVCLLDFTSVWSDHANGATFQEDAIFSVLGGGGGNHNNHKNSSSRGRAATTVAVVLGGGVAICVTEIVARVLSFPSGRIVRHGWFAQDPYVLPLALLSTQLPHLRSSAATAESEVGAAEAVGDHGNSGAAAPRSLFTKWGQVLDCIFVSGYSTAETLVVLHSAPGGVTWTGRLARENTLGPPPLYLTALAITASHRRTALLWSLPVTQDALYLKANGENTILVVGVNTITIVHAEGRLCQIVAVNGWARATCPAILAPHLKANHPLKLALQLDGSDLTFLNARTALVVLRRGQVYLLQCLPSGYDKKQGDWSLLPTGQTLTTCGEVAHLQSYSLGSVKTSWLDKLGSDKLKREEGVGDDQNGDTTQIWTGLVLAGSRLGDSHLMGYGLEKIKLPETAAKVLIDLTGDDDDNEKRVSSNELVKLEQGQDPKEHSQTSSKGGAGVSPYERMLAMEEEALYAPVLKPEQSHLDTASAPNLIQASSEDDDSDEGGGNIRRIQSSQHKRQRRVSTKCSTLRFLAPLDRLVHLGPIGPSCEGPLGAPPPFLLKAAAENDDAVILQPDKDKREEIFGASAWIFPCGYGSSGSLALATVPGRDDRMILSEVDCLDAQSVYSLPSSGLVLLGMSATAAVRAEDRDMIKLLWQKPETKIESDEQWQELETWTDPGDENMRMISKSSVLLNACEMGRDGTFAMFLQNSTTTEENPSSYCIAILRWNSELARCVFLDSFAVQSMVGDNDPLLSCTPIVHYQLFGGEEQYAVACHFASGTAVLVLFSQTGLKSIVGIPFGEYMDMFAAKKEEQDEDEDTKKIRDFYSSQDVVALDLFRCSPYILSLPGDGLPEERDLLVENRDAEAPVSNASGVFLVHPDFDEEDLDLYGFPRNAGHAMENVSRPPKEESDNVDTSAPDGTYLAVFRQSGILELYEVGDSNGSLNLAWMCNGAERGLGRLTPSLAGPSPLPMPRSHMMKIEEARFFMCGPSLSADSPAIASGMRSLCMAVTTSSGDFFLYCFKRHLIEGVDSLTLDREQLQTVVSKRSQEQSRHRTKLTKKGIIPKTAAAASSTPQFWHCRFFRFTNVSGQDGLFAALPQPKWIVSERGRPTMLCHRTRHSAPAGAKPAPVTGFCSPLPFGGGYLILHERVGRFGSQRVTMFRGISPIFQRTGLMPGGGICVERIAMGVTIRQIQYIGDTEISSGNHPLYAMLVSRELEVDQSDLNDDGMTPEERDKAAREKEEARIQRQVEADLGGFDVEQEWVEEIVRDDVFQINTELGGAPPIQKEFYSLWIVDAADEWRVVDSYDLQEWEHGMTLQVMSLTEFNEEPGSVPATIDLDDITNVTFVTLGTGTLNHNGEDVSSKGRVLLFEVRKVDPARGLGVATLSLTYEKEIFHGPVSSLSCLIAEGRNRLVIGAGADVNVEQWGNGKLTQVGFFRATMQILNIMLFKNFFLLSDAYDSVYFLVWRESDKSLTLLAKDYDPIAVYAAGIMSRGAAMTFLCHDDRQNLQFFQYAPGEAAARGGNKLVCRSDFHLGTQTIGFRQHYCRSSLLVHSATPTSTLAALKQQDAYHGRTDDDQRLGVHFGSSDGRIHSVVPLGEPVYWRLAALQSVLANALESDCALSPRAWRLYRRSPRRGGCRSNDRKKGVIDGDLIFRYADLPLTDQENLASAIGSTVELILDNLLELECSSIMM